MSIITLIVVLLIVGFFVYLINSAPFINQWFKNAAMGLICLLVLIYILQGFGLIHGLGLRL